MRAEYIFAILLLVVITVAAGCAPYTQCRADAFTRNAHPNLGLGTIIADAIDPPKPHPPLDDMLAECEKLK